MWICRERETEKARAFSIVCDWFVLPEACACGLRFVFVRVQTTAPWARAVERRKKQRSPPPLLPPIPLLHAPPKLHVVHATASYTSVDATGTNARVNTFVASWLATPPTTAATECSSAAPHLTTSAT